MTIDTADGARPVRTDWRDFPAEYIQALNAAGTDGSVQLGPMSWNDARFAQREFYRLIAVLRRMAPTDDEAGRLDLIARRLRVSCPRCETDLTRHWFVLQANPIVQGMEGRCPASPVKRGPNDADSPSWALHHSSSRL